MKNATECTAICSKLSFERASFSSGERIRKVTKRMLGITTRAKETKPERRVTTNRQLEVV